MQMLTMASLIKALSKSALCAAVLVLASCIDGDEEIVIGADGSASVKAFYRVPSLLLSAEDAEDLRSSIETELGGSEGLRLLTNTVKKQNGKRVIALEFETEDLVALSSCLIEHGPDYEPGIGDKILHAIVGRISISLSGLSASLSREVDLKPLLDEYLGSRGASALGNSEFRYTIHLPYPVDSSNAHEVVDGGKTLKWSHRLTDHREVPIQMLMVTSIPIPWWVYAACIALIAVLAWAIIRRLVKRYRAG
ncbi:MAG: hypothetical protein ACPH9O_01110 [Akkermansiaceae bacterium]